MISCSSFENKLTFQDAVYEDNSINRILYLYFSAEYDSVTNKTSVKLINKKFPTGTLKKGFHEQTNLLQGDWLFSFFDSNDKLIEKIEIENPLIIRGEFPDENGNYQSVSEVRETIEFFIRINLNRDMRYLTIDDIKENGKLLLIGKFDLLEN